MRLTCLQTRQVCTWYKLPLRPHRHLITESGPDEDTSSVVQRPEETIIRTRLNTDQLHPNWLLRNDVTVTVMTLEVINVSICLFLITLLYLNESMSVCDWLQVCLSDCRLPQ